MSIVAWYLKSPWWDDEKSHHRGGWHLPPAYADRPLWASVHNEMGHRQVVVNAGKPHNDRATRGYILMSMPLPEGLSDAEIENMKQACLDLARMHYAGRLPEGV